MIIIRIIKCRLFFNCNDLLSSLIYCFLIIVLKIEIRMTLFEDQRIHIQFFSRMARIKSLPDVDYVDST